MYGYLGPMDRGFGLPTEKSNGSSPPSISNRGAPHPEGWVAQTKMNPNGKGNVYGYLGPMDKGFGLPTETSNHSSRPSISNREAPHPEGWVAQTKMNRNGKVSVHVYLGPMDDGFASPPKTPNGISDPSAVENCSREAPDRLQESSW